MRLTFPSEWIEDPCIRVLKPNFTEDKHADKKFIRVGLVKPSSNARVAALSFSQFAEDIGIEQISAHSGIVRLD